MMIIIDILLFLWICKDKTLIIEIKNNDNYVYNPDVIIFDSNNGA